MNPISAPCWVHHTAEPHDCDELLTNPIRLPYLKPPLAGPSVPARGSEAWMVAVAVMVTIAVLIGVLL